MKRKGIFGNIAILIMAGIVLAMLSSMAGAAIPVEEWNKTYGGMDADRFFAVRQTSDGGYVLAGYSYSYDKQNIYAWLLKTDKDGNQLWEKIFESEKEASAHSILPALDGGYIIGGWARNLSGIDFWVIKTDNNGNRLWEKIFTETEAYSIQATSDNGYIIAGNTYSSSNSADSFDAVLIKTSINGDQLWTKTFKDKDIIIIRSAQQTSDGGFVLAGARANSSSPFYSYLLKTDTNGNEQWARTFEKECYRCFVQQTSDGGYILTGTKELYGTFGEGWIIKVDTSGNEQWVKTLGNDVDIRAIRQTSDGGYVISGSYSLAESHGIYGWLIKTDAVGNQQWVKTFGGKDETLESVQQISDGSYIVAGTATSVSNHYNGWLIKLTNETPTPTPSPSPTPTETPTANQPPVASFTYSPTNPKAGEQINFDASGSNDLDGKVVLAEWDWNNDGKYDENSNFPTAVFWFPGSGTYTVSMRITDDSGNTNVTSKQITVSTSITSKANIVLASWYYNDWNPFLWWNQDYQDFKIIDAWLREKSSNSCQSTNPKVHCWQVPSGSKPLDWINSESKFKRIREPDIMNVLDKDIDHDTAPGLTYKQYVLSAIREEDIVNGAFRAGMSSYIPGIKVMLGYLLPSLPEFAVGIVSEAIDTLLPYQPGLIGPATILSSIGLVIEVNDLQELSKHINEAAYVQTLGIYFGYVYAADCGYGSSADDQCLENEFTNNQLVGNLKLPPISETDKATTISETKAYWKKLWRQYGNKGSINGEGGTESSSGLYDTARQDARNQIKQVLISALEKKETIVTLNREYIHLASPGELRVYDSQGNVTGLVNGVVKEEIPYSLYDEEAKNVEVFGASGSYRYEVKGTGTGVYGLQIDSLRNGTFAVFNATDIPMTPGQDHQYTIDWNVLFKGEKGVTLQIDYDGDGTFDRTIKAGANLSDITPPEINIVTPANGISYFLKQSVLANWQVIDLESGISSSTATVPNGTAINTATIGNKNFSINATDNAGNTANKTVSYNVIYNFTFSPDNKKTAKSGSAVPIKFRLTDFNGKSISTAIASVYVVTGNSEKNATSKGKANSGNIAKFDTKEQQYVYILDTKPIPIGTLIIRIRLDDRTIKETQIEIRR